MAAIGIDLGTTNSCIAHDKNGKVDVIPYSGDSRTLPSYIGFWKDEILFGHVAKKRLSRNVENTIYDVKRMIGRNFSDELVQKYIDRWDFNVIKVGDKIRVSINQSKEQKEAKLYSPEELSALLIKELKNRAESALDKEVTKAVITVPTYFNDSQRQATIDAGKLAGFKEIKLVNEPTAAAIAYSFQNVSDQEKTIFVFDFGGGTFDVSLIKFQNKEIQVIAIDGDIELGGNDIDDILYKHITQINNLDFKTKSSRRCRLKEMCEEAKKQLSSSEDAIIELYEFDETDQDLTITREEFNRLNEKVFRDTKDIVERCLKNANMDISNIDDIVMVGGSSKIRKIGDMLREYFGKQLKYSINQDEAVAIGAAMVASQWGDDSAFKDMKFYDISPFSLGVETAGGMMNTIIPRFSKLPAKDTKTYCTTEDYQEVVKVNVYSGENHFIKNNHYLGTLKVSGFQIGPARSVKLKETFELDKNGILTVSVLDPSRGKSKHLTINLDKGRFSEEELNQKMTMIEQEYWQSKEAVKFKKLKNDCTELCRHPKLKGSIPEDCEKMLAWLKDLKYSQQNVTFLEAKAEEFQYHLSRI